MGIFTAILISLVTGILVCLIMELGRNNYYDKKYNKKNR